MKYVPFYQLVNLTSFVHLLILKKPQISTIAEFQLLVTTLRPGQTRKSI